MGSPTTSPHIEHSRLSTTKSSFQTSSSRCTQCNTRKKENGRNLVVCIDGTSNQFGHNNTNVVKLFAKVDLETTHPEQYAYYSSGIGTRPKSLHIFDRMQRAFSDNFDMAIAWNMEEIVKDAYGWLAQRYQEGDQIYLFGFSRGAYQVRVLAGMIHEVGLIRTPTEKQIGTAYDHFEAIRSGKPKTRQIAREFKNTFSWEDLRVHFVGVWDTVSSVGLIRGDVFLSTSSSAAHACHFRHALALDELRVKFMPEYFHEMNSQTYGGQSKDIAASLEVEHVVTPASEWRESTVSDNSTGSSRGKKNKTGEIKEVWFAGSHSDVGGKNIPGKSQQAGNVSLVWMRREAIASGLVLQPTDIVWIPDDLDFGIDRKIAPGWKAIEYMPITHQISFSGTGENARRQHRLQPRRIIPGQKVHASILYANAYNPQATLGEGFEIPTIHAEPEDAQLDDQIWETGFFDDTAAQELMTHLGAQQGVAPIYLDRLLFMLRFKEGKQCVRNVPHWQDQFMNLIRNRGCDPLVRLVTIAAYYEASCDSEAHPKSPALPHIGLSQDIFDDVKGYLTTSLPERRHRDGPRVAALLRPLTKHEDLRKRILTQDVLKVLTGLVDFIIEKPERNFGQAMDGLNCLLRCEDTRQATVRMLCTDLGNPNASRLSRILEVNDRYLLAAALRMVLTLARIPEARRTCLDVKPRINELARKYGRLVGLLSVEILLVLYDSNADQLDISNPRLRANLASALLRLSPDRHGPADGQDHSMDLAQQILRLFGFDAAQLGVQHGRLIGALKNAVEKGNARERTAATMTFLKLCETEAIREYVREIKLLDVFVNQLQRKDSALLAAYALVACLKHSQLKESITDKKRLPKHIVGMLRLDYFDDAVGPVEGFQIFADFMRHDDLRKEITKYKITEILNAKLGKGKPKEIRTSLICLNIFRSFEPNGTWTSDLVTDSMRYLKDSVWKVQKAGVAILSALAQTDHGTTAIESRISEIVEMLLPYNYRLTRPTASGATPASPTSPSEDHGVTVTGPRIVKIIERLLPDRDRPIRPTVSGATPASPTSPSEDHGVTGTIVRPLSDHDRPIRLSASETTPGSSSKDGRPKSVVMTTESTDLRPPSWMMGPACALRILAQNNILRDRVRRTIGYSTLKDLFLSGALVAKKDTSAWRVRTPNRKDVIDVLGKMIKAVDGELSEEGLTSTEDAVLPQIQHWNRLMTQLRDRAVFLTVLPALLGVSALAVVAVAVSAPIYLSVQVCDFLGGLLSVSRNSRTLDDLFGGGGETDLSVPDEGAPGGDAGEGPSSGQIPQSVAATHGVVEMSLTNPTNQE